LDLNGRKANSEAWSFTRDGDEKEWFEELRAEDPYLLVGFPAFDAFDWLRIKVKGQSVKERVQEHMRVAFDSYRDQRSRGKHFLHIAPWKAESLSDEQVKSLTSEGAWVVRGPMCRWMLQGTDRYVRTEVCIVTDVPEIAEAMRTAMMVKGKAREWMQHLSLMGEGLLLEPMGVNPCLANCVVKALRVALEREGHIGTMEAHSAGPVPIEPNISEEMWSAWDDVNGGDLNPAEVQAARAKELDWLHQQGVYTKRSLQECREVTGRDPIRLLWIDTNKGDDERPNYRSRLVVSGEKEQGS